MSFVKKAFKKIKDFVKKYWVIIVIAAAVVFTAGVAAIGFSAFAGGGFTGFMGAMGSTMVAGAQAIVGLVGIGSGATVGTAGSGIGSGVLAGTKVGFGAAAGLGGGAGIGAGAAGAAATLANASVAGQAAITGAGVVTTGLGAAPVSTTVAAGGGAGSGLSLAGVGKMLSGVGAVVGPAMTYYGNKAAAEAANQPPLASWGVPIGEGDEFYEDPANYMPGQTDAAPDALMTQAPVGQQELDPTGSGALTEPGIMAGAV